MQIIFFFWSMQGWVQMMPRPMWWRWGYTDAIWRMCGPECQCLHQLKVFIISARKVLTVSCMKWWGYYIQWLHDIHDWWTVKYTDLFRMWCVCVVWCVLIINMCVSVCVCVSVCCAHMCVGWNDSVISLNKFIIVLLVCDQVSNHVMGK